MRLRLSALLAPLVLSGAFGQPYTISTFAGSAPQVDISGKSAGLGGGVYKVVADPAGNLFFPDQGTILRLDASTGVLTQIAGNGTEGFSGDNGPAAGAQLFLPQGVAVNSAGNLYIADRYNARVRKVSRGAITTVAGTGTPGFSGDNGPAASAQLSFPKDVAVDSDGNLYIADEGNNRIRKVSNGVITTVAGGGSTLGDNGPATSAQLSSPSGIAVDSAGSLYIADYGNNRIRKVSGGVIATVAGGGSSLGDNGPATSAQLNSPSGVAVDSAGNLYIADSGNNRIRKVSSYMIATVAGNGTAGFSGDNGPATSAQLSFPNGVAVDSDGNLYIADTSNSCIREVSNGMITSVAGNGTFSGDHGPATSAQLLFPWGVAADSAGNVYIADEGNNRIRKVSGGVIATVAGSGSYGFSGDNGPATSAQLDLPRGVAVDSAGNLYIADYGNNRIRKVSSGVITTVAGGGSSLGDNGPATSAQLNSPSGVAVDSAGNLYIADSGNQRIRKVSSGVIATVAGGGSSLGDNGPATSAQLNAPQGVAVDSDGNLYIADSLNYRIRKVSNGVITTVAGNGTAGFSGDNGPAASAQLGGPSGVAVDSAGNLYIADNNRIRKVSGGVITTVAGSATYGFSGDNGPATGAQLNTSQGVAVAPAGNVYIADQANNRIRLLSASPSSCTYTLAPTFLQPPATGGTFSVAIQTTAACPWTVSGLPIWITISGASSGSGPATITFIVAPNTSGAALSANISIAGVSFTVTQGFTAAQSGGQTVYNNFGTNNSFSGNGWCVTGPYATSCTSYATRYIAAPFTPGSSQLLSGISLPLSNLGGTNGAVINLMNSASSGLPGAVLESWSVSNLPTYTPGATAITLTSVASKLNPALQAGQTYWVEVQPLAGDTADYWYTNNLGLAFGMANINQAGWTVLSGYAGQTLPAFSATGVPGYSDFGPNNGFSTVGWCVSGSSGANCITLATRYIAAPFTPGTSLIVSSVTLPLSNLSGTNGAVINLMNSNSSGVPGAVLESWRVSNLPNYFASNVTVTSVASKLNPALQAGQTYWVEVEPPAADTADYWYTNNLALAGGMQNINQAGWTPLVGYVGQSLPAFNVVGASGTTPSCTYSLNPTSLQSPAAGGNFNVAIQTAAACPWTVSGLPNWITVSGASTGSGPASITLMVAPNTSNAALNATVSIAGVPFAVTQASGQYTCTNTTPPVIASVDSASAYGGYSYFASGSWLEVKGANLADPADPRLTATTNPGQWTASDFNGVNAPTNLDGISVSINGKPAYVWYLSPTQLNVQAPEDSATGNVAITVTNCKATSSPFALTHLALAPGMLAPANYSAGGTQYMVALFASDGAYVLNTSTGAAFGLNSRPAKPGDLIIAYGIGFGDVIPSTLPGVIVQQTDTLVNPVAISFGSTNATLAYSGLAYGLVGLYQFNIFVPTGLANGDYQINMTQNGTKLPQTMYLTVQN
jgi:uncharacterized protein (TIGR03437 family)